MPVFTPGKRARFVCGGTYLVCVCCCRCHSRKNVIALDVIVNCRLSPRRLRWQPPLANINGVNSRLRIWLGVHSSHIHFIEQDLQLIRTAEQARSQSARLLSSLYLAQHERGSWRIWRGVRVGGPENNKSFRYLQS